MAVSETADIIIQGGQILTMDPQRPTAQAIAIIANRIAAVGTAEEIGALRGPRTRVIEAGGGTVLPGFNEGHMHLFLGAAALSHLQLRGVQGFGDLQRAIQDFDRANPGDGLIIGQSADYTILSATEPLSRHHLDRILPNRPLMLLAPDSHTAWANTIALDQAGILHGRKLGPGNEIVMEAGGLAQGELREREAFDPVYGLDRAGARARLGIAGLEPDASLTEAERAADRATLKRGLDYCAQHGITSIQNMDGNRYTLDLLREIDATGDLTARVRVPFHMKEFMPLDALARASRMNEDYRDDRLQSGFVKVFVDGVLDSWTAVMLDDYADRPGWRGEPLFTAEHFRDVAIEADRRGLQIAVHAIGDGAVRIVLDGYAAAREANGARDSRHRIEHIEVVSPDDVPRFAALGVVASMQPPHPPGSAGLPLQPTISRIGEAKWPYAYAWKTLRDAGAKLVFATDWPVSPLDPLASIGDALTRKPWRADLPDHRPSLDQALAAYTRDSAWVEFMEDRKGQLTPGYLADIVILSGDIVKTAPEAVRELRPVMTICDGVVAYRTGA
jgi:predicted amidohydrolase YtcJ